MNLLKGVVGAQGRLPQNMLQWHIKYFELKLLEKQLVEKKKILKENKTKQNHSDPPLSPWKREINLPCRDILSTAGG